MTPAGVGLALAPNPLSTRALVTFSTSRDGAVHLRVYDAAGRLVRVLVEGARAAGPHAVQWDARGLAVVVYMYRLETPDGAASGKVVVLR